MLAHRMQINKLYMMAVVLVVMAAAGTGVAHAVSSTAQKPLTPRLSGAAAVSSGTIVVPVGAWSTHPSAVSALVIT